MGSAGFLWYCLSAKSTIALETVFTLPVTTGATESAAICFLKVEYYFLGYQTCVHARDCFPRPWATLLLMSFTEFAVWFWALPFSLQVTSESRHVVSLLSMHYISNLWWIPFVFLQNNWKAFGKWSRQSIRKLTHQNSPGLQELGRRNMQLHLTSES